MRRREFFRRAAGGSVAPLAAAAARRIHGANDRIIMALIGCGHRGVAVGRLLDAIEGVAYAAVCDVYDVQTRKAREIFRGAPQRFKDFRTVLELKHIDAVHVATPDHWHAVPTVMACQAGKHVYVEKPLAHNVQEGQAMVRAARKAGVVVLTGTQQRSAPHVAEAAQIIQSGRLGEVRYVRVWNYINTAPDGIGEAPDSPVPPGLDWDFYLGPAPLVPFNRKRFLGTFRYFSDYAGGRITDFGVHRFDTVHQIMGADGPVSAAAAGGRFTVKGMGDYPDLLQVTYEYPGFVLSYEMVSMNGFGAVGRITPGMTYYGAGGGENRPNGMAFYGSSGTLIADRLGYEIIPETERHAAAERYFEPVQARPVELKRRHRTSADATAAHARHFIRCLRAGEPPRCDALVGHRSTLVAHLGNIAYRTGRKLRWDAARETLLNAPEASRLLGREARKPWDLI